MAAGVPAQSQQLANLCPNSNAKCQVVLLIESFYIKKKRKGDKSGNLDLKSPVYQQTVRREELESRQMSK